MGISEYSKIDQDHAVPAKVGDGDNVKHGDLSSALFMPDKNVDIHMDAGGLDFSCVTCHVGEGHEWAGSRYEMTVNDKVGTGKAGSPPRWSGTGAPWASSKMAKASS